MDRYANLPDDQRGHLQYLFSQPHVSAAFPDPMHEPATQTQTFHATAKLRQKN